MKLPAAAGLLASVVLLVLMLGLRSSGMLQALELMAYDRLVLLRAEQSGVAQRVVQIGITEADVVWQLRRDFDNTQSSIFDLSLYALLSSGHRH